MIYNWCNAEWIVRQLNSLALCSHTAGEESSASIIDIVCTYSYFGAAFLWKWGIHGNNGSMPLQVYPVLSFYKYHRLQCLLTKLPTRLFSEQISIICRHVRRFYLSLTYFKKGSVFRTYFGTYLTVDDTSLYQWMFH